MNNQDKFSVGNQFELDEPTKTLTEYLNTITTPDMDYCSLTEGFEACKARMAATGGSCQIDSITGLYQPFNVSFSASDSEFINSFGTRLLHPEYLRNVYTYLANRDSMNPLLLKNRIDPTNPIDVGAMLDLKHNNIYNVSIGMKQPLDPSYWKSHETPPPRFLSGNPVESEEWTKWWTDLEGSKNNWAEGHSMLLYKTDYQGLKAFTDTYTLSYLTQVTNKAIKIITRLKAVTLNLDIVYEQTIGVVCIIIDICQREMYTVTELDYPNTTEFLIDGRVDADNAEIYNRYWKYKIIYMYNKIRGYNLYNIVHKRSLILTAEVPRNAHDIKFWKDAARNPFFNFYVRTFGSLSDELPVGYDVPTNPLDSFYGKMDRKCNDDKTCEHDNLICVSDPDLREDISYRGPICLLTGMEGAKCIEYYLARDDKLCTEYEELKCYNVNGTKTCLKPYEDGSHQYPEVCNRRSPHCEYGACQVSEGILTCLSDI